MKTIIHYECEICRRDHLTEAEALTCEARGYGKEWPIGMIFGDHLSTTGCYRGFTFAVAANHVDGHFNNPDLWVCRPSGRDTLGSSKCMMGSVHLPLGAIDTLLDPDNPTFQRMVAWLQSQNILVTVWNGSEPMPLDQWLLVTKFASLSCDGETTQCC